MFQALEMQTLAKQMRSLPPKTPRSLRGHALARTVGRHMPCEEDPDAAVTPSVKGPQPCSAQ